MRYTEFLISMGYIMTTICIYYLLEVLEKPRPSARQLSTSPKTHSITHFNLSIYTREQIELLKKYQLLTTGG